MPNIDLPTRGLDQAHTLAWKDVVRLLQTDPRRGLSDDEARRRLDLSGPNELPAHESRTLTAHLASQLTDPMALLLMAAAAISGIALREALDALVIGAIVVLNAVIALVQEGKAERALEALKRLETPMATVVRADAPRRIPARELVPGDIVLLAAGDKVPGDVRLIDAESLEVDESLLTGESLPVSKQPDATADVGAPLSERIAMLFSGTLVTRGTARGAVAATGADTALGAIAAALSGPPGSTPLQEELRHLTSRLGTVAVVIAAAVFALAAWRQGGGIEQAFLSAVALAVAAVPEGLATVVTVALALGVRRMATLGAIVRRLPAVETLGSTTVILTDKTGTLTQNHMRWEGTVLASGARLEIGSRTPVAELAARIAVLCNDAPADASFGDPVDVALLEAVGPDAVPEIRARYPRIAEVPFDSERKRMSTLHRGKGGVFLAVKGAPESVIERSLSAMGPAGRASPLHDDERAALRRSVDEMAERGARVLALAYRNLDDSQNEIEAEEDELTFVALAELRDPLRKEAPSAVASARSAGIAILMVTGDHPGTARSIASEVGIAVGDKVVTGRDLKENGVPSDPLETPVYARVDPSDKLSLVEALKRSGHVTAVTGDGVNDAPALRRADIGVAMGRSGTDAAREAADMVVTDDNLATIVGAVREGRAIYDNIRKVVEYLVAANLSEIVVVVTALLLFPELGVPLLPLQLLWINLVTDGLPAVALGVDPPDPHLMQRRPRREADRLLNPARLRRLLARAALLAGASLVTLVVSHYSWGYSWSHARGTMFTTLAASQLVYALAVRKPAGWKARREGRLRTLRLIFANRWLLVGIACGLALQILVGTWAPLGAVFDVYPLGLDEWGLVAASACLPSVIIAAALGFRRVA